MVGEPEFGLNLTLLPDFAVIHSNKVPLSLKPVESLSLEIESII